MPSVFRVMVFQSTITNQQFLRFLYHHFAQKAVRETSRRPNPRVTANSRIWAAGLDRKVENFILRAPAYPLAAELVLLFNHHFNCLPNMSLVSMHLNLLLFVLKHCQAARFLLLGNGIREMQCGRIRPGRVLECENAVVSDFIQKRQRLLEISFSLGRASCRERE